jgi:class 3 adenylate cyclase
MTEDEVHTIKTLKEYRNIMAELIKHHSGRVVDAPGDNLLAESSSAANAVQCSVEIQKALKARNADLPDDKRLEFRIGVNISDVVQDGTACTEKASIWLLVSKNLLIQAESWAALVLLLDILSKVTKPIICML